MIANKKTSILLILKTLEEYSDENHYLTQANIIELIKENYGIELERKSVSFSLNLLEELGYDIMKKPKTGYALFSRLFDESEVKFLVDAIFSSKVIEGFQAKSLSNKVSSVLSKHLRKDYSYIAKTSEVARTSNKDVFLNIEIINEAIRKGKWVGFKYITYDADGKQINRFNDYVYHASPCYLVNNFGKYYLLAYRYKYDSVIPFRVDYMTDIYVMEERERLDPKSLEEFKGYSSITEYINTHIYLFGGKVVDASLRLNDPSSLSYIYDWFGKNSSISKDEKGNVIARIKCDENALFYWLMQYGEHVTLLAPIDLIKKVKEAALKMAEKYKNI